MKLDQLLHFARVAEQGSFTRAAVSLDMTQPALSRSVRQLEVDLHKSLFHRHGRGIVLTDEGRRLLELTSSIFAQLAATREIVGGDDACQTGYVTVGLPPTLGRALTVPLIHAFRQRFPRAKIAIVEGLSRSLMDRVVADRLNIALLFDPPPCAALHIEPLASPPLYLFSASDNSNQPQGKITFPKLAERSLLLPTLPNPIRAIVEAEATRRGLKLDICCEVDGVEAILELVRNRIGDTVGTAALLEGYARRSELQSLRLIEPDVTCTVSLATPEHRPTSLLQERTIALVRDLATSLLRIASASNH